MGRIKKFGQRKGHGNQHNKKKCSVNNVYMRNSDSHVNRSKVSESDIGGKNVNISATPTSNNSHETVPPPSSSRRKPGVFL
jgi:hypothetical protein